MRGGVASTGQQTADGFYQPQLILKKPAKSPIKIPAYCIKSLHDLRIKWNTTRPQKPPENQAPKKLSKRFKHFQTSSNNREYLSITFKTPPKRP
jgi:hypothetical protein